MNYTFSDILRDVYDAINSAIKVAIQGAVNAAISTLAFDSGMSGQVPVTDSSTSILAENSDRKSGVILYNAGANVVYVAIGEAATTSKFILVPRGAVSLNTTRSIAGICSSGLSSLVSYTEI